MFNSARLKLTLWYLLIIMMISAAFSVVIYRDLMVEVQRFATMQQIQFQRQLEDRYLVYPNGGFYYSPAMVVDNQLISEVRQRIVLSLIFVNGGIAVIAGGLAFFLAGRTLQPIRLMIEEQNRFISDSSHELRTPLTALKSSIEVTLRDKSLKVSEAKTVLKESLEEVNKLQLLADRLLQLAQYQKPKDVAQFTKFSLKENLDTAIHQVKPLAQAKDIRVPNFSQELKIEGNQYGLHDLWVILLENAIKYSSSKSTITVSAVKNDGHVQVSIQDQGIGIDSKDLPHIFDRFYRADTARSHNQVGGYGLGLSIAKKIVEVHRGQIKVDSQVGNGTRFIISLPIKQTSAK